jgi:hypothetical protein
MSLTGCKRAVWVLGIGVALLVVLLSVITFNNLEHTLRLAFADEQTQIFEDMRIQASQAEPPKAVEFLDYAVSYYPSGSKQVPGSRCDRIVERARRSAVREIIADLRARTGQDLGDDPQRWVEHFKKP